MATLSSDLRQRIHSARALPSPPVVTAKLIELCEDPNANITQILDVLGTDAALTARLMRLANSPIYAQRRRTENLRQAVMLLGLDAVLTASLSLSLTAGHRNTGSQSAMFARRCWTRSVHAAAAAQIVGERIVGVSPSDAFLASLLQDIGIQVVNRLEPTTYEHITHDAGHEQLIDAEIAHLAADHTAIGAELLECWKLPQRIADAVRVSHRLIGDDVTRLSSVVAISALIADGINGEPDSLTTAADAAAAMLDMDESDFAADLERLSTVLPDLALILDAEAPDPDTLVELAADVIVARQVRSQSVNAELHRQVADLTTVAAELHAETRMDSMTGLFNRRALDDALEHEFRMADTHGFPMSVLFIDLDDFKQINDRLGHTAGDDLLVQASRRISGSVREGDIVGRFGGEEFIVILPGAPVDGAEIVAQRIIDRFSDGTFDLGAKQTVVQTVSIGVATHDQRHRHLDARGLVAAADASLYTAKRNGKNQWRHLEGTDHLEIWWRAGADPVPATGGDDTV